MYPEDALPEEVSQKNKLDDLYYSHPAGKKNNMINVASTVKIKEM